MQEITIFDVNGNSITDLVQWDKDVKIFVKENEIDKAYNVHFFNRNYEDTAMVVESTYQDGKLSAVVPNDLLIDSHPITGYIYIEKNNEHKSIYCFRIVIRKRPKPANYIYSDQKEYITFEKVLEEAKGFSDNAKESYNKTKQSEENAKISEENVKNSEEVATQKADESKTSAEQALQSELNANISEENSLESAENSEKYALQSKSFAKGTGGIVRQNDDSDCAEYYYNQILQISQGIKGIIPMGTITFDDLQLPGNQHEGFMFNISDTFISDERFNDGGGISYGAGNNVIFTADSKWDVLASSDVSGVKGDKETYYHQGFVNITPENIGAVATDGDISDTTVTFEESETRNNIESKEKINTILGKIKKIFSDLKTIAFSGNFNDLTNIPNATVTVKQNGNIKGEFTMNQSSDVDIELFDNDTTYNVASESNNGLMSADDKKLLNELNRKLSETPITKVGGKAMSLTSTDTWYRLGYIPNTSMFFGEFLITSSWNNHVPEICKFMVGGGNYSGTAYNIVNLFHSCWDSTNNKRIKKARVVYVPRGTEGGVYVDVCLAGTSGSNNWRYELCMNRNGLAGLADKWVDSAFTGGATIPSGYTSKEIAL